MELELTGRHVEITPALERLIRKELKKLDRILDSAPKRAHVILSSEKHRQRAEIILYWRDFVLKGVAENNDLSQSISNAAGKVERQMMRLKERFQSRKRKRAKAIAPAPAEEVETTPRIIQARRYRVKPMTQEEAALMLADSKDQFIVFRDAETQKVGVLYKRPDGNFGLIEP